MAGQGAAVRTYIQQEGEGVEGDVGSVRAIAAHMCAVGDIHRGGYYIYTAG